MARALSSLAALVASACSAPSLPVELPFEPGDRAAVVVIEQGEARRYFGVSPGGAPALPRLEATDEAPLTLSFLAYEEPLDRLGFPVDQELFPSTSAADSRPLLPWARKEVREIGLDGESRWRARDRGGFDVLETVRVRAAPACRSYSVRSHAVTATTVFVSAFRDGPAHVVACTEAGDWLRFDAEGNESAWPDPLPGLAPTAAARGPTGATFVGGLRAGTMEVWTRRDDASAFEPLPSLTSTGAPERILALAATATVVYALTSADRALVFDGAWRSLELPRAAGDEPKTGGAIAIAPDGVAILHPGDRSAPERRVSLLGRRSVRIAGELPASVTYAPGFDELLFGTHAGHVARLHDDAMVPLFQQGLMADARTVVELLPVRAGFRAGVAAFGNGGRALEVYENGEVCTTSGTGIQPGFAFTMGDDVLLLGNYPASSAQVVSGERTIAVSVFIRGPPP